jgi:uncharacterized membrane protein
MSENNRNPYLILRTNYIIVAFMILALVLTSSPPIKAQTYVLRGKLVDSNGSPLSDVNITVLDTLTTTMSGAASGIITGTFKSSTLGMFRIPINPMDHIVFSKKGYVTKSLDISNSFQIDIDVGTITLENDLRIVSVPQDRIVAPGTTLLIPLELDNVGDLSETCQIILDSPQSWKVRLIDEVGEFNQITLSNGVTKRFALEVGIPYNASGTNNVLLTVNGYTSITWGIKINVRQSEVSFLSCLYPSKVVLVGDTPQYELDLVNRLNVEKRFQLSIQDLPVGWQYQILNADSDQVYSAVLAPDSTIDIVIEVFVPQTTPEGVYHFKFVSEVDGVKDFLDLSAIVKSSFKTNLLITTYPSQTVQIGKIAVYDLSVNNPSRATVVYSLSSSGLPQGWDLKFKNADGAEVQQITVTKGGSQSLSVDVIPSLTYTPGKYHITLLAQSSEFQDNITIISILESYYSVQFIIPSLFEEMKVGDSKTLSVTLTNNGFSPLTKVELGIESTSASLLIQKSPSMIDTLQVGESQVFEINVQAGGGTVPSDYLLKIKAQSREFTAESEDIIRLSISQGNDLILIAFLMVAVAIVAVFVVMRWFKRR